MSEFKSADEILLKTDANELRQQRWTLMEVTYGTQIPVVAKQELEGLIAFLDVIADYMADQLDMKDVLMFDDQEGGDLIRALKSNVEENKR